MLVFENDKSFSQKYLHLSNLSNSNHKYIGLPIYLFKTVLGSTTLSVVCLKHNYI